MSDVTKNILDTISLITNHAIAKASFDHTIQCIILSCEDQALGLYKVKYQDSIWTAHSANLNIKYPNGSSVYVLIPGNDMSSNKTIIGSVSNLGKDYLAYEDQSNNFIENGINIINESSEFGLCSFTTEERVLYSFENINQSMIQIDKDSANEYIKKSDSILLKADFRTNLVKQQRRAGNYGINLYINFYDEQNINNTILRKYTLDIDSMQGNPYLFNSAVSQKIYYSIDANNFKEIYAISIFDKDFNNDEENIYDNDIFISNIQLIGVSTLSLEQKQGNSLRFRFPQGYIFTNRDQSQSTRSVIAQLRFSGKIVTSIPKIKFYWFQQDASIDAGNEYYYKAGGKGWRCLNQINTSQGTDDKFLPKDNTLNIIKSNIPIQRMKFKCVAVYEGIEISNTFEVLNNDSEYLIDITADKELIFFTHSDSLILKCNIKRKNNASINLDEFTFHWKEITENNIFYTLEPLLSSKDSVEIFANQVRRFSNYCCSVYRNNILIGSASVTIFKKDKDSSRYILTLNNGVQLFKYDEAGDSPYNKNNLEERKSIPELSFSIRDTQLEKQVQPYEIEKITWVLPVVNTLLLEGDNEVSGELTTDEQYKEYNNLSNFVYNISNKYNISKTNNTITLKVQVHGIELITKTNFIFTKEGQLGTNGTQITCKIIAEDFNGERLNDWLINKMLKSSDYNTNVFNPNWNNLNVELWKEGERLDLPSNTTIKWEMLNNKDNSWYTIDDYGRVSLNNNITIRANSFNFNSSLGYPANIIKVTVTYDGRNYYDTIPIVTVYSYYNHDVNIEKNCGFKYVVYSQDGELPKYDNTSPFSVVFSGTYTESNINWYGVGSIRNSRQSFITRTNLSLNSYYNRNIQNNLQRYFKPSDIFDGSCVTNAVVIKGQTFCIHIPIHFMLNKYGHKNLNDWDGNSIAIDDDGNYILSPQIGAGYKDLQNNTFTGIVMGLVKDVYNYKENTGLFGYHAGERVIFLDAESGRAEFGASGSGQIILDPTQIDSTTGRSLAQIKSGNYKVTSGSVTGQGLLIDLTTPEIKFGSGNFSVSSTGSLTAKIGKIGPWHLTNNCLYYKSSTISNPSLGTDSSSNDYIYLGTQGFSLGKNFIYNNNTGNLTLKVNSISIGGTDVSSSISNAATAASNAATAASNAATAASNAAKTATNYLFYKANGNAADIGLYISKTALTDSNYSSRSGGNIRIADDGLHIYRGTIEKVHYGDTITFYRYSNSHLYTAATLDSTGLNIKAGTIQLGLTSSNVPSGNSQGFYVSSTGEFIVGKSSSYLRWDGSALNIQGKIYASQGSRIGQMRAETGNGQPNFHSGDRVNYNDSAHIGICLQTNGNFGTSGCILSQTTTSNGLCHMLSWEKVGNLWQLAIGSGINQGVNMERYVILQSGGYCYATSWESSSDERLKIIQDNLKFDYKNFLMQLKPIVYQWKDEFEKNQKARFNIGFGAQTVEKILKKFNYDNFSFVNKTDPSRLFLCYTQLFVTTIPVIQEHEQQIRKLENKIQQLTNAIQTMKK